jgi:hypothetical protein
MTSATKNTLRTMLKDFHHFGKQLPLLWGDFGSYSTDVTEGRESEMKL